MGESAAVVALCITFLAGGSLGFLLGAVWLERRRRPFVPAAPSACHLTAPAWRRPPGVSPASPVRPAALGRSPGRARTRHKN
jgi:hypothetical protein